MSRKSDLHSHLSRRIGKKHDGLHTVTTGTHHASASPEEAANKERPFEPIKFEASDNSKPSTYKSIFGL